MQTPNQNKVIVRYPPSPTGNLHIGNIRTMLFNYLFAKHAEKQGSDVKIFMRFEDTDKERSKKEFEYTALEALSGLGITFTDGPYRQSERTDIYIQALQKLIKKGLAYQAEKSNDGSGDKVIRFKNPNKKITFTDAIRGEITIDTTDFGDFVIARSLVNPLYHLTVVVDDIDMGVTHIIRGEDHITSTPRQILLIEALGGTIPHYAHLPLIIGKDKKKLGKRHGAITYQEFKKLGYLNEAIINYLALLGWSEGNDREFYTISELEEVFTLEQVSKSPAMFSYHKLDSINRHYILQLPKETYENEVIKYITKPVQDYINAENEKGNKTVVNTLLHTIIKERIHKWGDVPAICENELSWLNKVGQINPEKLIWKKSTKEDTKEHLNVVMELLSNISNEDWEKSYDTKCDVENEHCENSAIKKAIWDYASKAGRGDVLWPMRYALTGKDKSPDPFIVGFILGKEETLKRLFTSKEIL